MWQVRQYSSNVLDKASGSLVLYDNPDSVTEDTQKHPHSRLAARSLDKPLHSTTLRRLNLCGDRLSPEGRDGRAVYQSTVLPCFDIIYAHCTSQTDRDIGFWSSCPFHNTTEMQPVVEIY